MECIGYCNLTTNNNAYYKIQNVTAEFITYYDLNFKFPRI